MTWIFATLMVGGLCVHLADEPQLKRFERTEIHMGTSFTVVLYAPAERPANEALDAAMRRIGQLDQIMSDYNPESELSRLSASSPTREPAPVSDDLWRVLEQSQRFARESDGAFDITVGPFTRLWRRSRRQKELPSDALLDSARAAVGHAHLILEAKSRAVSLLKPGMRLDLGGIGQGFAADEALRLLRDRGFTRALVNASGDIVCGDAPPGETGWKVGIAPLQPDAPPSRFFSLSRAAISTSGDAFQYVEIGGKRYSHIVDPRTGLGMIERVSASVLAPDGATADAFATAVCVLGPDKGLALIERLPRIAAVVVAERDGKTQTWESRRCADYGPLKSPQLPTETTSKP